MPHPLEAESLVFLWFVWPHISLSVLIGPIKISSITLSGTMGVQLMTVDIKIEVSHKTVDFTLEVSPFAETHFQANGIWGLGRTMSFCQLGRASLLTLASHTGKGIPIEKLAPSIGALPKWGGSKHLLGWFGALT